MESKRETCKRTLGSLLASTQTQGSFAGYRWRATPTYKLLLSRCTAQPFLKPNDCHVLWAGVASDLLALCQLCEVFEEDSVAKVTWFVGSCNHIRHTVSTSSAVPSVWVPSGTGLVEKHVWRMEWFFLQMQPIWETFPRPTWICSSDGSRLGRWLF